MADVGGLLLGIDVGGTFTDVLALDPRNGRIVAAIKLPSTADDPARGAVEGIDRFRARSGTSGRAVFHGTTVGTNALITKRGARAVLLTTRGFRDVLALRRHARPRLYDLAPAVSPPLVARAHRIEVDERLAHDGSVLNPLTDAEIARAVAAVRDSGAEAVAICLLHAYASDVHERRLEAALRDALPGLFVTRSSDLCSEFREFERTSTVAVNAFIGPVVARYTERFETALAARGIADLAIVKSNGGLTSAANARRHPVHLIESGPAAGLVAAAALGRAEGLGDLIAFDMGGTTAKAGAVVGGAPRLSTEFYADRFVEGRDLGGYPIKSPVIDLIEIGAGGGSIAWLDAAGVLKVGPESAGAEPGPACYGRGGTRPTVTDAHVALGHIAADGFGSEDLTIDPDRARAAIAAYVAGPLGWSVERAAAGILTIAEANMAEMVRLASLRRGLDPRDFTLVAFGGAGPLHAAGIAREVGIPRVAIPPCPGLFSAIGTLLGEVRHDLVQTHLRRVGEIDAAAVDAAFAELGHRAAELAAVETVAQGWVHERSVDARFDGQMFELTLPVPEGEHVTAGWLDGAFRAAYRGIYGYDLPEHAVQLVNLRLVAHAPVWQGGWPAAPATEGDAPPPRRRRVHAADGSAAEVAVWRRDAIRPGAVLDGPLIVEDFGATIRVLAGQRATALPSGVLLIEG
ncbi:MAG: hydantoinase/oxoprolinase family protein [Alphaproteobacteria bacterium]